MALALLLHYACTCRPLKTSIVVARGLNCLKNSLTAQFLGSWNFLLSGNGYLIHYGIIMTCMAKRITIVKPPLLQTQIEGQKQVSTS